MSNAQDVTNPAAAAPPPAPEVITAEQWKAWGADPCTRRVIAKLEANVATLDKAGRWLSETGPGGRDGQELDRVRRTLADVLGSLKSAIDGAVQPVASESEPPLREDGLMSMSFRPGSAGDPAGGCGR